jgi:hypothetical protein
MTVSHHGKIRLRREIPERNTQWFREIGGASDTLKSLVDYIRMEKIVAHYIFHSS